ncbi:MAG: RNA polymerase sigma factor [Pseudomonadales bacterium]|nr:RNA polymerase sigma factor [Pseudomonadales bacterium]
MDNEELENLLARCALRDQNALERLYQTTAAYLNGVAYSIVGSTDESNDVVQEAFLQIWDNAENYTANKGSPLTWMTSIVRYRALDKLKSENRHRNRPGHEEESDILANIPSDKTEEGQYMQFRLNQQLQKCLEAMNEKFRKSLEMAYLYGYSREELADMLGANINTVKSWLRRGSDALKQCMEGQQEGLSDG